MSATSIHNNWIRFTKRQLRSIPFSNILIKVNWGVFQLWLTKLLLYFSPKSIILSDEGRLMWRLPLSKLIICWDFSKSQQHLMQFSKEAAHQVLKLMYKKSRVRIELKFWWNFRKLLFFEVNSRANSWDGGAISFKSRCFLLTKNVSIMTPINRG